MGGYQGMTALGWRRGGSRAWCFACGTLWSDGNWHHLVSTIDYATGDVVFYVNGTMLQVLPSAMTGGSFRSVPPPGGEVVVGATLEGTGNGLLAVSQLASMLLDDFRVHDRPLSAGEVALGAWKSPQGSGLMANLVLHWTFNDPDGPLEVDLSGRGSHGQRGALGNRYGPLVSFRAKTPGPVRPPRFSNGPVLPGLRDIVAYAPPPGQTLPLAVLGADVDGRQMEVLKQLPTGQLTILEAAANDSLAILQLETPPAWPSAANDSIMEATARIGGGPTHDIRILMPPPCSAPTRLQRAMVGTPIALKLGGVCSGGVRIVPEITEPPSFGRLFRFVPGQTWPYFLEIQVRDNCITSASFDGVACLCLLVL